MAENLFYETATRGPERRAQGKIVDYLQRRFDEEKRKNPKVEGMTYSRGNGIKFRYAPDPEKDAKQKQYQEWIKTRLWWAKQGIFI
jgi:hypothetical protein